MSNTWKQREVYIAGTALSTWGYYPDTEPFEYAAPAVRAALKDAGFGWADVQAVFCGAVYGGTGSGHRVTKQVGLTGVPIVNIENACSSSTSALRLAYHQIATGIYDVVLVFGIEKNPKGPIPSTAFRPWESALGYNFHPGNYALETVQYQARSGATEEDLSLITVKNRKNAVLNPNARYRKPVTLEEVMASRQVAPPLRLLHCCPLADGASVAVVCSEKALRSRERAVRIAAAVLGSANYGDGYVPGAIISSVKFPPKTDMVHYSAQLAYDEAGIGPEDIDIAQVYDTVTPSELWDIEELGLCPVDEAPCLLREGVFDLNGRLPINTDGGLMGRGHAMGATGLAQVIELVTQIRGEAGDRQVAKARVGLAHNMGAGPNSSVTIVAK
jgi:acetyl-CoA acetyltransferase